MNIKLEEFSTNTAKIVISNELNAISLFYSYKTLIAIKDIDNVYYVSENVSNGRGRLSQTTAKHLNAIEPNKDNRLKREAFEKISDKIISRITLDDKKLTTI